MPRKKTPLTDAQKAANVAKGLTPSGRIPSTKKDAMATYPINDYRSTGNQFTASRKNAYLDIIRETGDPSLASKVVGVRPGTVSTHRTKDPMFREAMDEARRQHGTIYLNEMRRRGVEGYDKPVFGSQGPGAGTGQVGVVREYSDQLLLQLARKFDPELRPTMKTEANVKVAQVEGVAALGLEDLSPESQEDLQRILEREVERRKSSE